MTLRSHFFTVSSGSGTRVQIAEDCSVLLLLASSETSCFHFGQKPCEHVADVEPNDKQRLRHG